MGKLAGRKSWKEHKAMQDKLKNDSGRIPDGRTDRGRRKCRTIPIIPEMRKQLKRNL